MNSMIVNTDRLIELIIYEDKNVLKELLTTDRVVYDRNDTVYYTNIDIKPDLSKLKAAKEEPQEITKIPEITEEEKKKLSKKELKKLQKQIKAATQKSRKKEQDLKKKKAALIRQARFEHVFNTKSEQIYVRKPQFIIGPDKPKLLGTFKNNQRMGILTHPSWLISHSDAMDNHAILRGIWIRERLLGDAVPDVPITVDAMLPDEPNTTLRHRMRVTREDECWRCHQKMDPLGLPFEKFNHAGLMRNNELGKPVDTTGEIVFSGDPKLDGKVSGPLEMIKKLAESERVEQVFVRHVFRYWMGRNETINDAPVLKAAHKAYKESGGSMKALLVSLLTSDAFLYRKVE